MRGGFAPHTSRAAGETHAALFIFPNYFFADILLERSGTATTAKPAIYMPIPQLPELVARLRKGDQRALARVLSFIEDGGETGRECVEQIFPFTGHSYVLGITGSPGAGKSTLVDQLAKELVGKGAKVGIIAVDPSSPFSGGALLGDRIRMNHAAEKSEVFIRSMASRGALGGLAPRTAEAIFAFDAAGFDFILIETVGVGQGEVEIVRMADTVMVVLVPGMGDGVQAMKAGVLEIADVFAINKADYDGADRLEKELKGVLNLIENAPWVPPIVRTVATEGSGADELLAAVTKHRDWADRAGASSGRRELFLKQAFSGYLSENLKANALRFGEEEGLVLPLYKALFSRQKSPQACADELQKAFLQKGKGKRKAS